MMMICSKCGKIVWRPSMAASQRCGHCGGLLILAPGTFFNYTHERTNDEINQLLNR